MDQKKTGELLKSLRKEKEFTQAQVAEKFHTTNRSVSRWENGSTMPDISVLVELADFYEVDVRELIDGERNSQRKDEEVKEIAHKVADYAEAEKDKLMTFIRGISLTGVIFLFIALILQTVYYEPGVASFAGYICTLIAFATMIVMALFANGILRKIVGNKKFDTVLKVSITCMIVLVVTFVIRVLFVMILVILEETMSPSEVISGIENYDKNYYIENYGGDLDSTMLIFPDNVESATEVIFESELTMGLLDTDGYIILYAEYEKELFKKEKERLSDIKCTIQPYEEDVESVTKNILYDENSYNLPAYVTSDGYSHVYEYALVDDANCSVTYVYLGYPETAEDVVYNQYLKSDLSLYNIDDALNQFTIYAHSFDNGESWTEVSDMVQ